jgi:hypothetical protein
VQKIKEYSFYPAVKNSSFIAFARKKTSTRAARTCSMSSIRVISLKCFIAVLGYPVKKIENTMGTLKNGMKIST